MLFTANKNDGIGFTMQGETNADWRMGEHMKNNILIINEDEKEAIELKHRLKSTTTNVFIKNYIRELVEPRGDISLSILTSISTP